ncbi:hypothetical protein EV360DRAFT_89496 [Lentinula raphanica]|nr:hypothetical protein EV360DRAFT_89496 [Lentinula raphanica]
MPLLQLVTSLDSMCAAWEPPEMRVCRRLVRFTKVPDITNSSSPARLSLGRTTTKTTALFLHISGGHAVLLILAVKLHILTSSLASRLSILSEQPPALTLHDVLQDCDSLREERASEYLGQGLNAIHSVDLVHRGALQSTLNTNPIASLIRTGTNPRCIGLETRNSQSNSKHIKLFKAAYHTRLVDLNKSNEFRTTLSYVHKDPQIPDAWLVINAESLVLDILIR